MQFLTTIMYKPKEEHGDVYRANEASASMECQLCHWVYDFFCDVVSDMSDY